MEVGKEDARRFLVARQLLVPARSLTGGPDSVLEVVRVEVARRVLDRIRVEGPLSSGDFERQGGPTKDWFGAPKNAVRAVLEAYALTGELGTARREGNRPYYDVVEPSFSQASSTSSTSGSCTYHRLNAVGAGMSCRSFSATASSAGSSRGSTRPKEQCLAVWWEDGFGPRRAEGFVAAMRDALGACMRFASKNRIEWPSGLRTEKRLFGTTSPG